MSHIDPVLVIRSTAARRASPSLPDSRRCRDERPEVTESRRRGWAYSSGEVIPGLASVATWLTDQHHGVASIACVFLAGAEADLNAIAVRVVAGAGVIKGRLASAPARP